MLVPPRLAVVRRAAGEGLGLADGDEATQGDGPFLPLARSACVRVNDRTHVLVGERLEVPERPAAVDVDVAVSLGARDRRQADADRLARAVIRAERVAEDSVLVEHDPALGEALQLLCGVSRQLVNNVAPRGLARAQRSSMDPERTRTLRLRLLSQPETTVVSLEPNIVGARQAESERGAPASRSRGARASVCASILGRRARAGERSDVGEPGASRPTSARGLEIAHGTIREGVRGSVHALCGDPAASRLS